MFSDELSTLFTGRNIEINVLPLSFCELYDYLDKKIPYDKKRDKDKQILDFYLTYGGMPILLEIMDDVDLMKQRLATIVDDVIEKDVKTRHKIRNITEFKKISKYIFDNNGNQTSTLSIYNYLISNKENKLSRHTIDKYQKWMCDSLLIYKNMFYDIKGKHLLNVSSKYYCVDTGIKNINTNFKDEGKLLENVIFLQLLREGYTVYSLFLQNGKEIDFLAIKDNKKTYIQVVKHLDSEEIRKRGIGNLLSIKDNNRKIIIVKEGENYTSDEGIEIINIIDYLKKAK